ncbi:toll/interleukin-1 receptor domain-containing protein [Terasakiella pusilla]|uniref:toll/interleukin-1 receptor domain-containing protein n=1 Tax=Terasakiella pusilla TaxID=64973 RepID=UPI003AA92ED5
MARLFFSYCHKDETLRDQLETHLMMLKRQCIIDVWHDRRIVAGSDIDAAIDQELESADIILFLVSSDFLASNYCYDVEVARAMERHKEDTARVIPVILRPCDWHGSPFGKLLALPTDGLPVTKWADIDEAFLSIVTGIKEAAKASPQSIQSSSKPLVSTPVTTAPSEPKIRSANLRVTKEFTQQDRDEFRLGAFEYMAKFFTNSLVELQDRHTGLKTNLRRVDSNRFTAIIYRNGQKISACTIFLGGISGEGISYCQGEVDGTNTCNETLSIEHDDQTLYLKAMMNFYGSGNRDQKLSMEGASEHYWEKLMEPLQRQRW